MSVLDSKLDAQIFAFRDFQLCLNRTLTLQRDEALDTLATASREAKSDEGNPDGRLGVEDGAHAAVKATEILIAVLERDMRDASITLRFTAVNFGKWNSFIVQNPPRKNHPGDASFGYNTSTFFLFAARQTGKFLDDDGELVDITEAQWKKIEDGLTDGDHDRLAAILLELNKREGQRGVDFLSRASSLSLDSDETSESLSKPESAPAASLAGSPRKSRSTSTTKKAASPAA